LKGQNLLADLSTLGNFFTFKLTKFILKYFKLVIPFTVLN